MMTPRSPCLQRLERQHAGRRLGDAAEGADEIDLDDAIERVDREMLDLFRRLVARRGLDGVAGAGAVDQDAFLPVRGARLGEARIDLRIDVTSTLQKTPPSSLGERFALLGVEIEDRDLDADEASARAVAAPRPDAPPVMTAVMFESSFMTTSAPRS